MRLACLGGMVSSLCLALAPAAAGPCSNDCGIGDLNEGEICPLDEYADGYNGGCNWDRPSALLAFCNETFCGSASTYDFGGQDYRDTDWYLINQAELYAADVNGDGVVQIFATLTSEFSGIVAVFSFQPDCSNTVGEGTAGYSDPGCLNAGVASAVIIPDEHPFGILVVLAPEVFDGFECATGLNDYTLLIECADPSGGEVCLATGNFPGNGFLEVCTDAFGSWESAFGGLSDYFNPAGEPSAAIASFTNGLFIFNVANQQRALLSANPTWQAFIGAGKGDNLSGTVLADSTAVDTDGDGINDRAFSQFRVTGPGIDLDFDLLQDVGAVVPGVAAMTQAYTIRNDSGSDVDFSLVRLVDADLNWAGGYTDDSVGTGTNGSPADRHVFMQEAGDATTAVTVSNAGGDVYYGAKNGVVPPGGPAMGMGIDFQIWDSYGVPANWEDYIAGVGANVNGESGAAPPGCVPPCDGHVALEIPVSMSPGQVIVVTIIHTYGDNTPHDPDEPTNTSAAAEPRYEAVGDLDGNGINDVVVVLPVLGSIQIFRNLGDEPDGDWIGFLVNPPIALGANPSAVTSGLFNDDLHLDIAVTNRNTGAVTILINNGLGNATFTITQSVPVGAGPSDLRAGDFVPAKGHDPVVVDLAVTLEDANSLVVLENDGTGSFSVWPAPSGSGFGFGLAPRTMASGDFDGNKCPDLVGGGNSTAATAGPPGMVFIAQGQTDGTFLITELSVGTDPVDVAVGDLNGDGINDVAVADPGEEGIWILIGNGSGGFQVPASPIRMPTPQAVAVSDLNLDTFNDLAVAVADDPELGPALGLLVNNGPSPSGNFSDPLLFELGAGAVPHDVAEIFLNGDCLPDIVVVRADPQGFTNGALTFLLNVTDVCPWDLNNDETTNMSDFKSLLNQWGSDPGGPPDLDGNGVVDISDFLAMLANWGSCPCEPKDLGAPAGRPDGVRVPKFNYGE